MNDMDRSVGGARRWSWRAIGREIAFLAALIGIYLLLSLVVLPRLGFET
jgi:hypothetical protein